jgi:hypothetical protein
MLQTVVEVEIEGKTRLYSCSALAVGGQSSGRVASLAWGQPVYVGLIVEVRCECLSGEYCKYDSANLLGGKQTTNKSSGSVLFLFKKLIRAQ